MTYKAKIQGPFHPPQTIYPH